MAFPSRNPAVWRMLWIFTVSMIACGGRRYRSGKVNGAETVCYEVRGYRPSAINFHRMMVHSNAR